MLSTIVIVRKATIRTNITPRSSVINYKEPDIVTNKIFVLVRIELRNRN
jgi:hypothetical protein